MSKRWLGLLLLGIWIGGSGAAQAAITLNPGTLDFSPFVVGKTPSPTKDETLTVDATTNNVTVAVHGGGQCSDFSVSPTDPFTIDPGPGQVVTVTFTPSSPGSKACVIDIKVDGTIRKSFNVSGTGQAPAITVVVPTFTATEVGKSSTAQLTLTNSGTSPLTINSATFGAGSPFSAGPVPAQPIAVSGQATLDVTCTPATFGDFTDTLAIASDAFQDSPHLVSLDCTGTQGVLVHDQTATIDFTAVPRGATQTKTFKLSNTGNLDVKNIQLAIDPPNVGYSLDVTSLTTLAPGAANARTITVTFKPQSKADGGTATITITGSWGVTPTATQPLSLTLAGTEASFGLMPAQPALDFGKFRYDTHPLQSFQLLNDGNATLKMTAPFTPDTNALPGEYQVVIANGTMTLPGSATLAAGDHVTIDVFPLVQHRIGLISGHIDVTPDVGAPLRIPVTGVATAAEVEFPEKVEFGVVDLNQPPPTQTVTIKNTGDGALDIASITASVPGVSGPSTGAFAIALPSTPRQLAKGESLSFDVTYQPTVATAATSGASDVVNVCRAPCSSAYRRWRCSMRAAPAGSS